MINNVNIIIKKKKLIPFATYVTSFVNGCNFSFDKTRSIYIFMNWCIEGIEDDLVTYFTFS